MQFYRQGDIAIVSVDALPSGEAKEVERDSAGRIVLALGEVTGHAHAVKDIAVKMIQVGSDRFLTSEAPFEIVHEEHDTVRVPGGTFRIDRQREYTPEEIRQIAD